MRSAGGVALLVSNEENRPGAAERARCERDLDDTQRRLAALLKCRRVGETHPTGSVAVRTPAKRGARSFCSGASIRVIQLRGGPELGDLGRGCLLDDVAIGAPLRFSIEDGPAVVTSPVVSVGRIGARSIQVVAGNSIYRFDLHD
jgi:hypothetical protein